MLKIIFSTLFSEMESLLKEHIILLDWLATDLQWPSCLYFSPMLGLQMWATVPDLLGAFKKKFTGPGRLPSSSFDMMDSVYRWMTETSDSPEQPVHRRVWNCCCCDSGAFGVKVKMRCGVELHRKDWLTLHALPPPPSSFTSLPPLPFYPPPSSFSYCRWNLTI